MGHFEFALLALLLVAVLATCSDVLTQSMMQLSVPNKLRGRAMGSWILAVGASPLGHMQIGALAATLSVSGALLVNGGALIGVASERVMPFTGSHVRSIEASTMFE